MNMENERFKLIKLCLPPVENGACSVVVRQNITSPASDTFTTQMDFHVKGAHFSLPAEEIQALYPAVNANGNYADSIGHITLKKKTYPWENSILPGKQTGNKEEEPDGKPWLALICISDAEGASAKEIAIKDLLDTQGKQPDIFYPLKELPLCTEKPEDICRVVDLPLSLYEQVMPREEEIALLTHVKAVDLYDKYDNLAAMDGYFSVVVSNRFIPSGEDTLQKSTLHLVSLEGFGGYLPEGAQYQELQEYKQVRLVSLFCWEVYSTRRGEADFKEIIRKIDSGPLAINTHEILKRGQIPLRHITRTGEETVSLYRGPLLPYRAQESSFAGESSRQEEQAFASGNEFTGKNTADGYLIYDPVNGIMDVSYSCAWQLGRLLILKDKAIAMAYLRWKRDNARQLHAAAGKAVFDGSLYRALKMDQGDIVDFWAHTLCREVMENMLVAPIARDPKNKAAKRH